MKERVRGTTLFNKLIQSSPKLEKKQKKENPKMVPNQFSNTQQQLTELQQCCHRIVVSLRLDGTLPGLQSNLLLKAGSTQNSDQVSQGFVHLGLENLQRPESTQPLWTSVPKLNYPLTEFIFPCIQADPPHFQFVLPLWTSVCSQSPPLLSWKVWKQCQDQTSCCGENKDIKTGLLQRLRAGIR